MSKRSKPETETNEKQSNTDSELGGESSNKKQKLASIFSKSKPSTSNSNPFWRNPPDPIPSRHDGAFSGVLIGIHGDPFQKLVELNKHLFTSSDRDEVLANGDGKGKGKENQVSEADEQENGNHDKNLDWKKVNVVALDLDGTIIQPKKGKKFPSPSDPTDFELVFPNQIIKKLKSIHESGSILLILSNQKQTRPPSTSTSTSTSSKSTNKPEMAKKLKTWKEKVKDLIQAWDIPMIIIASLAEDSFRKPRIGMWEIFGELLKERIKSQSESEGGGLLDQRLSLKVDDLIDIQNSKFVGDAAGRIAGDFKGKKVEKDWNDTDRKFALNAGLDFLEPEQFFLGEDARPFELKGWKPTLEDDPPPPVLSEEEILNPSGKSSNQLEVVLFVGPPASGKSSFYRKYFEKKDYVWVNQDQLKTKPKCLSLVEQSLKSGKSCVVDNTNRDEATRKEYLQKAKAHKASVRCIFFDLSRERCEHNAKFRAWGSDLSEPSLPLIPGIAFSSFYSSLEQPPISETGEEEAKLGYGDRTIRVGWRWEDQDEKDEMGQLSQRDREKRARYLRWYG